MDLSALVQDLVARAQEDAALARCPLVVEVSAPLVGHWDPMRLAQVITNLLSNALKYGAHRPVEVRVTREDGCACGLSARCSSPCAVTSACAASQPGEGATFIVRLPLDSAASAVA